ncbi:MAG TPA: protoheme IX farnesyltransferase, partial [Candidatus Tenderia sp.]|nr:protoheme IX farnesyltransferase [Candidatus Tenderia sp.]
MVKQLVSLFKLRIGVVMMFTALAAMAITPGRSLNGWEMVVLALAVL